MAMGDNKKKEERSEIVPSTTQKLLFSGIDKDFCRKEYRRPQSGISMKGPKQKKKLKKRASFFCPISSTNRA
jgi:hypothetical protein